MKLDALLDEFRNPSDIYRPTPLLRINDELNEPLLRYQLATLKERGFGGIFLCCEHMGEAAPERFLSDWWWQVVDVTARLCTELGLAFWVYDEEDWPSGSAGGQLTEAHPEHQWKYLHREEGQVTGPGLIHLTTGEGRVISAMAFQVKDGRLDESSLTDLTHTVADGALEWEAPAGDWTIGVYTARFGKGIFLDGYGDLMDRDAMKVYIDWVYEGHLRRVQQHAPGAQIVGYFTDEPAFSYAMIEFGDRFTWYPSMPYTAALVEAFQQRLGYDPRPYIPLLYHDAGPASLRFTCHWWDTCRYLYYENYFGQIYRFCDERGMKATGHLVVEEKFLNHLAQQAGNLPCHLRCMHIPGMDWIHPFEDTFLRLPSTTPKYPTSMAHLMGRHQAWAETFAASGWGMTPRDMRRIVNWEHVNGISMQVPISYKYSLRGGDRGQFYVPGLSYQQPYWDHMRGFTDYEARMCALAAGGGHVAQIALAYPEVDIWMHCWDHTLLNERSDAYNRLGDALRSAGYDYDILDDEAFLEYARVDNGEVVTSGERFGIVVVPGVDGMRRSMARYLLDLARSGGTVVFTQRLPRHSYEGGGKDPELAVLLDQLLGSGRPDTGAFWEQHRNGGRAGYAPEIDDVPAMLAEVIPPDLQTEDGTPLVAYHRRLDDGHLYLIYNYQDEPATATFTVSAAGYAERWDPTNAERLPVGQSASDGSGTRITMDFQPYEMVPLVLRDVPAEQPPHHYDAVREIPLPGPFRYRMEETLKRPEIAWNFTIDQEGLEYSKAARVEAPEELGFGDWCELDLATFSGIGIYEAHAPAPDIPPDGRVLLDLGNVRNTAEVLVNGQSAGIAFFEPHRLDITRLLRPGDNTLTIRVANTLSNYMSQFPRFEGQALAQGGDFPERRVSGLLGPVRLIVQRSVA